MASNHSIEVELTSYDQQQSPAARDVEFFHHDADNDQAFYLPPTDGGKDAWLCLMACFMLEAMIWGFPSSYGIFQEYYAANDFAGSSNIAVVGTCAMGLMYMCLTGWYAVLKSFPSFRKWAAPVGLVILCLALTLGSFSKNVSHLILTQGIMYSLGGCLAWSPILPY